MPISKYKSTMISYMKISVAMEQSRTSMFAYVFPIKRIIGKRVSSMLLEKLDIYLQKTESGWISSIADTVESSMKILKCENTTTT
jgi:hypothetical protein